MMWLLSSAMMANKNDHMIYAEKDPVSVCGWNRTAAVMIEE